MRKRTTTGASDLKEKRLQRCLIFQPPTVCPEKTCTTVMRFVDTNIFLYAVSTSDQEIAKRDAARNLLDQEDLALSVQVLQEFYVQATRTSRADPLSHEQATNLIESWQRYPVQDMTLSVMIKALSTKVRWNISYWDAAIIEAARMLQCSVVFSEDLQDGMNFDGVCVINPFQ